MAGPRHNIPSRKRKNRPKLIVIEEDDQKVSAVITNNGRIPAGEIVEGGGLSGLRSKVEGSGGSMSVSSFPRFSLKVVVPKKEEVL